MLVTSDQLAPNDARLNGSLLTWYIRLNQYLVYWPFKFITWPLKRSTTCLLASGDLKVGTRYVIASNHQRRIDPFIISGQLPIWSWPRLTPFRYLVYNRLYFTPLLHLVLVALGCFPTKPNPRTLHGLPFAHRALSLGQSPFIFPEGKRAVQGSPARPGIAELAKISDVELLPVHIEWTSRRGLATYRLTIGQPFKASAMTADEIMQAIYDLPV